MPQRAVKGQKQERKIYEGQDGFVGTADSTRYITQGHASTRIIAPYARKKLMQIEVMITTQHLIHHNRIGRQKKKFSIQNYKKDIVWEKSGCFFRQVKIMKQLPPAKLKLRRTS